MATKTRTIRSRITPAVRYRVYELDRYQCVYCGADLRGVPASERTLDHVVPVSKLTHARHKNEVNGVGNIVTCCAPCNRSWGANAEGKIRRYGRYGV